MMICKMDIVPQVKTVLHLQDNWYLMYSPCAITSYVSCINTSSSKVFVKYGANQIYVSPSYRLQLREHVLISDFVLHLDEDDKMNGTWIRLLPLWRSNPALPNG
jgi:hypothetical protein